jgi:MFS family permease
MGITAFGLALSSVIFPAVIVLLLPLVGWRVVWWMFAGAIAAIVLPVVVMVMRDRPTPEEGAYYVGTQARTAQKSSLTVRDVFSRRNFWVTVGVFVPIQCVVMTMAVNIAPLVASHGFSVATAGALISSGAVGGLICKLAAGMLADRFGNRIPLVLVALVNATGVAVLAFLGDQLPMLYVGMILIGMSGGVWTLLASATAAEFGADGFGRAFGVISAFTPIGAVAPPIVARLQEASGSYVAGLAGLAVLSLVGAGVALLMREKRPGRAAPVPELAPAE